MAESPIHRPRAPPNSITRSKACTLCTCYIKVNEFKACSKKTVEKMVKAGSSKIISYKKFHLCTFE